MTALETCLSRPPAAQAKSPSATATTRTAISPARCAPKTAKPPKALMPMTRWASSPASCRAPAMKAKKKRGGNHRYFLVSGLPPLFPFPILGFQFIHRFAPRQAQSRTHHIFIINLLRLTRFGRRIPASLGILFVVALAPSFSTGLFSQPSLRLFQLLLMLRQCILTFLKYTVLLQIHKAVHLCTQKKRSIIRALLLFFTKTLGFYAYRYFIFPSSDRLCFSPND